MLIKGGDLPASGGVMFFDLQQVVQILLQAGEELRTDD
jgi:hypothetical protein